MIDSMSSHSKDEVPPALPPKLYKLRRSNLHKSASPCTSLPSKRLNNEHQPCRQPSVQSQRSSDRIYGINNVLSLTTSDLHQKPRDELILMLLQLNHEKANLKRWRNYFNDQISQLAPRAQKDPKMSQELDALRIELKDIDEQLKAFIPITAFLNSKIRVNDVYSVDESQLRKLEYEKPKSTHSRKKSIDFLNRLEEHEVSRALEAEGKRDPITIVQSYGLVTSKQMLECPRQPLSESTTSVRLQDFPEEAAFRQRRLQLEAELKKLDELWQEASEYTPIVAPTTTKTVSCASRRQKPAITKRVANRQQVNSENSRPSSAGKTNELAHWPRRSTGHLHRFDVSASADLERQMHSQSHADLSRRDVDNLRVGPIHRSTSLSEFRKPRANRRSDTSKKFNATGQISSAFLTEPARAVRSRWKLSADEEDSGSLVSSYLPSPPPIPVKSMDQRRVTPLKNKSQLNRWQSFGDNLIGADPYSKPLSEVTKMSELSNKRFDNEGEKRPQSGSYQPTLPQREGDSTVLSEDPYEETPFVNSPFLTPKSQTYNKSHRSGSPTNVHTEDSEEQPLAPTLITAAVDYIPGEAVYDTMEDITTQTYPPNLIEYPYNLRALALPKPVYPSVERQTGKQRKPLTLPISLVSAFRVPEKSARLHRTQSSVI